MWGTFHTHTDGASFRFFFFISTLHHGIERKEKLNRETFFILTAETIARLVAIMLAIASLFLSLAKLKTLHQENVDINPALYILTLYFLYQAIWIFFLFIEGDKQAIEIISFC